MHKLKRIIALILILLMVVTSCGIPDSSNPNNNSNTDVGSTTPEDSNPSNPEITPPRG